MVVWYDTLFQINAASMQCKTTGIVASNQLLREYEKKKVEMLTSNNDAPPNMHQFRGIVKQAKVV